MIAVDPSVLVAILREEPEHPAYMSRMAEGGAVLGAPSVVEAKMVLSKLPLADVDILFHTLVRDTPVSIVDFTPEMAEAAVQAFRRYGKGRGHPAQLNFGDCMSYAVARVRGLPLLYQGQDFARTDIEPAWRP